jgi:hypothetical protein
MDSSPPSTKVWLLVHIAVPLLPFLFGGLIRGGLTSHIEWETFSASELAISQGLLCLFINQSLSSSELVLSNKDKEADISFWAVGFFCLGLLFIVLFGVLQVLETLKNDLHVQKLESGLSTFNAVTFCLLPLIVLVSVRVQRSFKLKATIR